MLERVRDGYIAEHCKESDSIFSTVTFLPQFHNNTTGPSSSSLIKRPFRIPKAKRWTKTTAHNHSQPSTKVKAPLKFEMMMTIVRCALEQGIAIIMVQINDEKDDEKCRNAVRHEA